jgi:hypothetical protein
MGSQCDIDKKNVIMVNIEKLSEEDQRKYTELQEYIKQQFLSGAKEGSFRQGDNQSRFRVAGDQTEQRKG